MPKTNKQYLSFKVNKGLRAKQRCNC